MAVNSNFVDLLLGLLSADSGIQKAAEAAYNLLLAQSIQNGGQVLFDLLSVLDDFSTEFSVRQLALVILRRLVIEQRDSMLDLVAVDNQQRLKEALLSILFRESNQFLRLKLSELCGELSVLSPWLEVIQYALQLAMSATLSDTEIGLNLITHSSANIVDMTLNGDNEGVGNLQSVLSALQRNLGHSASDEQTAKVILSAMNGLSALIISVNLESQIDFFKPLLPDVLKGFAQLLDLYNQQGGPASSLNPVENMICLYLEGLIEIGEERSSFFVDQLALFFEPLAHLLESANISHSIRMLILEFFVTLCCASPKKVRKFKLNGIKYYFPNRILPICVELMTNVDDDEALWEAKSINLSTNMDETEEDNTFTQLCAAGESALNRICHSLGVVATYPIISSIVQSRIMPPAQMANWKSVYSCLLCLGNYVEVSCDLDSISQRIAHENEILSTVMTFKDSAHIRLRNISFYLLCQFLLFHGKFLEVNQLDAALKILLYHLSSAKTPSLKVRRNVFYGLIHFINYSPTNYTENYVKEILNTLIQCINDENDQRSLNVDNNIVFECCVQSILALAMNVKLPEIWKEFYSILIPLFKSILNIILIPNSAKVSIMKSGVIDLIEPSQQNQPINLIYEYLFGYVIECYALIGEFLSRELFYSDAVELMNFLFMVYNQLDSDSDLIPPIMKAWVHIVNCIGEEFLPYLQVIMSKIFSILEQPHSLVIEEGTDMVALSENPDIEILENPDKQQWVAIRSDIITEQSIACNLLLLLIMRVNIAFFPYIEQTMRYMGLLIKSLQDDMRSHAISIIPELVRVTALSCKVNLAGNYDGLKELSEYSLGMLLNSLEKESSMELITSGLEAVKQIITYSCTKWDLIVDNHISTPILSNATSNPALNTYQLESITQCIQLLLRDSIQRRAVMKAENTIYANEMEGDEADLSEEKELLLRCYELHYSIAELVGILAKTHGMMYYECYQSKWHDSVISLSRGYCVKEDKIFSLCIMSDILRYSLYSDPHRANECMLLVVPIIFELLSNVDTEDSEVLRQCTSILSLCCELYPNEFQQYYRQGLQVLSHQITYYKSKESLSGHEEEIGLCLEGTVSAIGEIVDQMERLQISDTSFTYIWNEWLCHLPFKYDLDDGEKALRLLIRIFTSRTNGQFFQQDKVFHIASIFLSVIDTDSITPTLKKEIHMFLKQMLDGTSSHAISTHQKSQLMSQLSPESASKLNAIIQENLSTAIQIQIADRSMSSSPLSTAPIHDVLLFKPM